MLIEFQKVRKMVSDLRNRRVFVTGATGFVGSNLCERLLREEADVHAFIRKSVSSKPANMEPLRSKAKIFYGDLRDLKTVIDATKNIDVVFHLGAQSHVPDSVKDPFGTFKVNACGTLNILEASRINDVDLFVNAGSDKIYGDPLYLPLDEKHLARPRSPYDASKVAGEALCQAYYKTYGLKVCLPRFSNIYGPRQDKRKVIPDFIYHLLKNESPVIRSDGTLVRDYIYVDDAIDAYLTLVEKRVLGEVFNFGSGVGTSVLELCLALLQVSGMSHLKPVVLGEPTPAEIQRQLLDIKKAKEVLGWTPRTKLSKGLALTWEWYKKNPKFLED